MISLQFGKIKTVVEADTSLRPKKRKDINTLLKQAQKKQEHLKQLKSTEAGKVSLWLEFDVEKRRMIINMYIWS